MSTQQLYTNATLVDGFQPLTLTQPVNQQQVLAGWTLPTPGAQVYKNMAAGAIQPNTGWSSSALPAAGTLVAGGGFRTVSPAAGGKWDAGSWSIGCVLDASSESYHWCDYGGVLLARVFIGNANGSVATEITSSALSCPGFYDAENGQCIASALVTLPAITLTTTYPYLHIQFACRTTLQNAIPNYLIRIITRYFNGYYDYFTEQDTPNYTPPPAPSGNVIFYGGMP